MIQLTADKFHALYEIRDWAPFTAPTKYSESDIRFFVGSTAPGTDPLTAPSNHSPLFKLDESALDLGVRAMLQLSLDYMEAAPAR